ncbi:DNA-binding CsgD family transcriptional regulator [Nocardia transvalensis]|uniref:DNA-binding CsgD family transcriptional regulator n=1 Tax=Nocardia transvalensis TaxID=37333 RepID=A0A7W9PLV1_9NOCA|nr:LuxR family transcriptional regulator [Nocardia transvalensis]MBB5918417.1 DNA-binding CsgD family transcriptional regulator [Nocardia transvalensis]
MQWSVARDRTRTSIVAGPREQVVARPRRADGDETLSTLLRGGEPERLRAASALAVLGGAATVPLAAELAELDSDRIRAVVAEFAEVGWAAQERFAHPAIAARVLHEVPVQQRRELHGRAAELLHRNGFPCSVVASQLVAAGDARSTWAAQVLVAAADQALADDEIDCAAQRLELAYRASRRAGGRAAIAARLVSVEWRLNPSTRTRNFGRLKAALYTGRVPYAELPAAVLHMLWHGYEQHADHALARLERGPAGTLTFSPRVDFLCAWLRYTHPTHLERHRKLFTDRARIGVGSSADRDSPHRQAADLLGALTVQHPPADVAAAAQRILACHRLGPTTVEALVAAVDCLIHTDRLDTADAWCASLLAEAEARHAPTWRSIFAALRADTLLRRGNLTAAAENATLALNLVPAEHLGVWAGLPIAVLVRALTAQGNHTEAAAQLRRPVPRAMLESRFALAYLHAHGHHCLATGRPEEALRHFRQCGTLMRQWNLDFAWLVPWRNDMAAAYLGLGERRRAQALATVHLELIGGPERHPSGGMSLRILAATGDAHRRVPLLRRAVAVARAGADELELATTLSELGRAHRSIGDADKARPLLREAVRLAESCGSGALVRRLRGDRTPPTAAPPPRVRVTPSRVDALSPAERRVAELAALGKRNREIADTLDITTSTVEQHLTRVYRKLSVARRGELRFVLAAQETAESAAG